MTEETEQRILPELKVTDYAKSVEWYTKIARFEIEYDRPEHEFAMLQHEGARLMIETLSEKSRTMKVGPLEKPFGRGVHFQIDTSDVQALYDNFKAHGYPIFHEMEERWYRRNDIEMGNRQFWVQDPDGYLLRFSQDLGDRPFVSSGRNS
jgi:hypothetical protein